MNYYRARKIYSSVKLIKRELSVTVDLCFVVDIIIFAGAVRGHCFCKKYEVVRFLRNDKATCRRVQMTLITFADCSKSG